MKYRRVNKRYNSCNRNPWRKILIGTEVVYWGMWVGIFWKK
jgi:hypothetical protein